jgi:deazaflavin-dependent oxidoreductase (nitroreductase family)
MSDMSDFNAKIIEEFRANDGVVGGPFTGAPMLLLTTTGAKSGAERTNPLVYLTESNHVYVFASKAGAPSHPDWYRNLVAHPQVTVEVGGSRYAATATPIEGAERDRIFAAQVAVMPGFGEYQEKAGRIIPVVELVRIETP